MRSNLWFFPFMDHGFGIKSKDSLFSPRSQRFSLYFIFPKCFIVLCFILKSAIHFGLMFVEGVRFGSRFIFLLMDVQSLQHHLWKRLSFLCWIAFAALSKISWVYLCGSISGCRQHFDTASVSHGEIENEELLLHCAWKKRGLCGVISVRGPNPESVSKCRTWLTKEKSAWQLLKHQAWALKKK